MTDLTVHDFFFCGHLGSQGAKIEQAGRNHFRIELGHAPGHPEWCNLLQFEILRNARGHDLRLDVAFDGDPKFRFNHDASTWSYDGRNWMPVAWKYGNEPGGEKADTVQFPVFTEDRVCCGAQVPMSYEDVVGFMEHYGRSPQAKVHVIGQSLGGRNIYRLEITDRTEGGANQEIRKSGRELPVPEFQSSRFSAHPPTTDHRPPPTPLSRRRGFHVNQQHSGEHHGQWRMIGMIEWLLSDAGADFRRRSVWHFVLEMNPDAPSHGWYRVNNQGVDLNRGYLVTGAAPARQPHESYVLQKDFEALMASETPITAYWSMHTFPGDAAPFMYPGSDVGTRVGPATDVSNLLDRLDTRNLVNPLVVSTHHSKETICWHDGPHAQFGITGYLCEGSDFWTDKDLSIEVGRIFIQAMDGYYR